MPCVQYIGHLRTKEPVGEQRKNNETKQQKKKNSGIKGLMKANHQTITPAVPVT